MRAGLKQFAIRSAWPVALMITVTLLSSSSELATPGNNFSGQDKVAHFIIFGMIALAWARTFPPFIPYWKTALTSIFITVLFGAIDEIHQATVPNRSPELGDLIADALGAATATVLYLRSNSVKHILELKPFSRGKA